MCERLEARRTAVVLHLETRQKIIEALLHANSLSHAGRREHVNKALGLEVSRHVALDAYVFCQIVGDRGVKAVEVAAVAEESLRVEAEHLARLLAAQIGEAA